MTKNEKRITQTGKAVTVWNETIGTVYVKIPIRMEGVNCFIVIPGEQIVSPEKLCKTINHEFLGGGK